MRTILVVDDEQQIRELVRLSLELVTDWKIAQARSGEEALARVRIEAPDAILLDYHMPDLDGLGTLARLREEPANHSIPILIYTADRHAFAGKPLPVGLAGVIYKPFNPAALKEKIESLW